MQIGDYFPAAAAAAAADNNELGPLGAFVRPTILALSNNNNR